MTVTLDNLPKTIDLVRSRDDDASPEGAPVLVILDQTKLPAEVGFLHITDWREVIDAIKALKVRGAPAIGIAGAAAVALASFELQGIDEPSLYLERMEDAAELIRNARPTAVNLAWAVDRAMDIVREEVEAGSASEVIEDALYECVKQLIADDESANRTMGELGATLLPPNATVLTHCNAGSLATAFFGTALGVIYAAAQDPQRGIEMVYADETRPVCQGGRLTVWELSRAGVPVTLICDDMAATVLAHKGVDAIIVGADRIAANGDVANKVGTLGLAILADELDIPFLVAAPTSTIDRDIATGDDIVIEERDASEVLPDPIAGVNVLNPAFDVTPARYVDRIITEVGIFEPSEIGRAL